MVWVMSTKGSQHVATHLCAKQSSDKAEVQNWPLAPPANSICGKKLEETNYNI